MLSHLSDEQVQALLAHTVTDPDELVMAVHRIRRVGYAIDRGKQEIGVRCIAVPMPGAGSRMAVSVSGPAPPG